MAQVCHSRLRNARPAPMKPRKTIEIEQIKEQANSFFFNSKNELAESRKVLQNFVSQILMDTGNYKGFQYITKQQMMTSGYTYGVDWSSGKPIHSDESRIRFL